MSSDNYQYLKSKLWLASVKRIPNSTITTSEMNIQPQCIYHSTIVKLRLDSFIVVNDD